MLFTLPQIGWVTPVRNERLSRTVEQKQTHLWADAAIATRAQLPTRSSIIHSHARAEPFKEDYGQ